MFKISYFIVNVNYQNFYPILYYIYMRRRHDIKLLLIGELERFYLLLVDLKEVF